MKRYIGVKEINATPMDRQAYNDLRGWTLPADENGDDEGYLVEYIDGGKANTDLYAGYISWSPKDVFERAYKRTEGLAFGLALELLKIGHKVARKGWNGKGMFIYYVPANSYPVQTGAAKSYFGENSMVPYNAYMAIKNVDNTVSTWVPSVNDCLSDDWEVVA
jgi:hypothetical protein